MPATALRAATLDVPKACRLCGRSGHHDVVVKGESKQLVRCRACSVVFLDPQPEEIVVKEEFEDRHITSDERLEYFFGANRDPVLSYVASRIRKLKSGGAILDVGCAGGRFLAKFFPELHWRKYGVEPSRFAANRARDAGLHVYQGQLSSVDLPLAAFDVITVMGVLLYFRDPHRDLKKLQAALKPGGLLAVELPLAEAQLWRNSSKLPHWVAGKSRSLLGSGHLFYYNVPSITRLFLESGFAANRILPVPAMKQRSRWRHGLSIGYFHASRALWSLSGRRIMLGPDFLAITSSLSESPVPGRRISDV
jgi:SAM-dependent methyltransferase